jgi:hypothetical protein
MSDLGVLGVLAVQILINRQDAKEILYLLIHHLNKLFLLEL